MAETPPPKRPERPERPDRLEARERRVPAGPRGSIRWMKSILGRPLAIERRADGLHLTLQERRRSPEVIQAESMRRLREELSLRLLEMEHRHAATAMRHLVFVHDTLGRRGWAGVQRLASSVICKATMQLQMLVEHEPSKRLSRLVDKLRMLQAAAEAREERALARALRRAESGHRGDASIEVSEATAEEFEASQREWQATIAAGLDATLPTELSDGPKADSTPDAVSALTPRRPVERSST